MSNENTTIEKSEELADEHASITDRIEGLISMGPPSCDSCLSVDSEDRPEDGDVWPSPLTILVDVEGDTLYKWMNKKVCDSHTPAIGDVVDATHRVRARTEYVGDEHRHNGAHRYNVLSVKEVDE